MAIPLVLDENLRDNRLWKAIQTHNVRVPEEAIDVVRVGDAGAPPARISDPELLQWAIHNQRAIVTRDVNTLVGLHARLVQSGSVTPGIIVLRSGFSYPILVEELVLFSIYTSAAELASSCVYLPSEYRGVLTRSYR